MMSSPPLVDKSNTDVVFVDTRGIKNIKYVIFPNNKWIQLWDLWMILAIWYYAFATPFAIGISRGYISGKIIAISRKIKEIKYNANLMCANSFFHAIILDNSKMLWIFTLILNASFLGKIYRQEMHAFHFVSALTLMHYI